MKTINDLNIFNATPHSITFLHNDEVIVVEPDERVDAHPIEVGVGAIGAATLVRTEFVGTDEGRIVIERAKTAGADVIIGSIIAAQAYPGDVLAMVPAPGFERVPPAEKRMRVDKFTTF